MSLVHRTDFEGEEGRKVDKAVHCVHTLVYKFDQAGVPLKATNDEFDFDFGIRSISSQVSRCF